MQNQISKEQMEQLELQKEEAEKHVALGEHLKVLMKHPSYIAIVTEGFLKDYPKDLANAVVGNTGAYDSDRLLADIKAINTFVGYTMRIGSNYTEAKSTIEDIDAYMVSLHTQDLTASEVK